MRAAAASARRGRWSVGRWRRSGTALGLEEVLVVRLRIDTDGLRAGERGDRRHLRVLVGRILMDDRDVPFASIWDENQFLRWIPTQGIDARSVLDGRHDFTGTRIDNDGCLVAA